ncbi:MAG: LysM peptidoglycan-binding domain-containing protein [Akkermansiaceae bacterium]
MMTVVKVLAALIVLAALGGTAVLVERLKEESTVPRLREVKVEGSTVEPDEIAFERAREFLATGQFEEARVKLEFIVTLYPGSPSAAEGRRILGELNLDDLLSTEVMDGKVMYTVKSGDNFTKIALQHETTLDCIMHMNGLQRMDKLYPGNELVLLPLNFNIKIDVPRKRLSLFREGHFLKAYQLLSARTRRGAKGALRSKIGQKIGISNGSRISPVRHESYRAAQKVLILDHQGLQLREVVEADEENSGRGFFLSESDMEELALLLRVGNEVEVRFTNK